MKTIIEQAIKEKFGRKADFCEASGIEYSNYARLVKKFQGWIKIKCLMH